MQNDRDPISALLDFFGVTDFTNTLFAPTQPDPASDDLIVPDEATEPNSQPPILDDHLELPQSPDPLAPEQDAAGVNEESTATTVTSPSKLLPSETLTIAVESVTVDICLDDQRDRDSRSPELVVLGEGSMSARYDSVYDSLIRNLARRKRQALADELGDLFDAIQDQGYTYADLLGAMREILAVQTSGALWEDCLGDLDRAIERALRAQASEPEAFTVKVEEGEMDRDERDRPRLEPDKLDRGGRDSRDDRGDRGDRQTWNDSPITS